MEQKIKKTFILIKIFSKEIIIALVLAIIAAVGLEIYDSGMNKHNIRVNQKATATILVYDKDGKGIRQGSAHLLIKRSFVN